MLRLLAEGLRGTDGWLAEAFSTFPGVVRNEVHVHGGAKAGALIIEVRTADASLDDAVTRIKLALERLAKSGPSQRAFDRARTQDVERQAKRSLDPRHRIATLWRGSTADSSGVTPDAWRKWLSQALLEHHLAVVRVRPPREEASER
jgi:hypothetical protein